MEDAATRKRPLPHSAQAKYDRLAELFEQQLAECQKTWRELVATRYYREVLADEKKGQNGHGAFGGMG